MVLKFRKAKPRHKNPREKVSEKLRKKRPSQEKEVGKKNAKKKALAQREG